MRYRDLNISFNIENVKITILSICLERLLKPIPMHSHSKNSYELHYISCGRGVLMSEGKSYEITPGALFMTGPEVEHEQLSDPKDPMTEYCVYLKAEPDEHAKPGKLSLEFAGRSFWFGRDSGCVRELMRKTLSELEGQASGRELMIQSLMQQLILCMIRLYQTGSKNVRPDHDAVPKRNDLTYLIIEEAFLYDCRTITLDALAQKLGRSRRQTERLLQQHYGQTFQQKKTQARMFSACSLLRDSKKSVSDISEELGYSSCEHFSGSFKRYYGISPSKFRKSM